MCKKIILLLAFFFCYVSISAQTFSGGSGTSADPYLLSNRNDITEFAGWVSSSFFWSLDKYFSVTTNIGTTSNPVATMIGESNRRFRGTIYGNGNTITVNYVSNADEVAFIRFAADCKINKCYFISIRNIIYSYSVSIP